MSSLGRGGAQIKYDRVASGRLETGPLPMELQRRVLRLVAGGGQPLPDDQRALIEASLSCDVSRIRVHAGPEATRITNALGAIACTVGRHIFLGVSGADLSLLRHEAAHAVQQGFAEPAEPLLLDPEPQCELEAATLETQGGGRVNTHSPVAIQRHLGESCPLPPLWVLESFPGDQLQRQAYILAGNQAIEMAYVAAHSGNTVLVGSSFESFRDILLPRGVPDRDMWNRFLQGLRGIIQQRKPDIVDFTERVFYEIKTPGFAVAGQVQLESYYELANRTITSADGGGNWHQDRATWYPPHVLPYPGNPLKRVCTALTDHTRTQGLLFYQIYRRTSQQEEQDLRRRMVVVADLNPELDEMRDTLRAELIRTIESTHTPSGTELWIVASPEIHDALVRRPQRERMERTLDLMRVHGWEARRNPVMGFRNLGWTLVGLYAATMAVCVVIASGALLAAPAAAAPAVGAPAAGSAAAAELTTVATAATGLAAEDAVVVSLTAYRAARAAPAAIQLARVAGVLLVGSVVTSSTARAEAPRVTGTWSIRAVPRAEFHPDDYYEMDREVLYGRQPYRIIGKAVVP